MADPEAKRGVAIAQSRLWPSLPLSESVQRGIQSALRAQPRECQLQACKRCVNKCVRRVRVRPCPCTPESYDLPKSRVPPRPVHGRRDRRKANAVICSTWNWAAVARVLVLRTNEQRFFRNFVAGFSTSMWHDSVRYQVLGLSSSRWGRGWNNASKFRRTEFVRSNFRDLISCVGTKSRTFCPKIAIFFQF